MPREQEKTNRWVPPSLSNHHQQQQQKQQPLQHHSSHYHSPSLSSSSSTSSSSHPNQQYSRSGHPHHQTGGQTGHLTQLSQGQHPHHPIQASRLGSSANTSLHLGQNSSVSSNQTGFQPSLNRPPQGGSGDSLARPQQQHQSRHHNLQQLSQPPLRGENGFAPSGHNINSNFQHRRPEQPQSAFPGSVHPLHNPQQSQPHLQPYHFRGSHTAHQPQSVEERNQAIFRKVRGILNKLTPEKFDKLTDGLLALGLDSTPILKGVILLIFEKALEEPKYSSMYAQLCKKLSRELPHNLEQKNQQPPQAHDRDSSPSIDPNCNTFCRLLLIKCQDEFDNRLRAQEKFKEKISQVGSVGLSEEEEEQRGIAKAKMLGNIKFICELGRQGLVQENILHKCIQQLVSKKKDESMASKSEDLECLCQIMKTVGRLLDTEKARKLMDQYFERITWYSGSTDLPARIRFMLKDCLELRDNKWVPRRVAKENGPRTIGQIREEAARDLGIPNSLTFLDIMSGSPGAGGLRLSSSPSSGFGGGIFGSPTGSPSANHPFLGGAFGLGRGGPLPLYGHPALPLVGNPGQRALDDMGYFANFPGMLGAGPSPTGSNAVGRGSNDSNKSQNRRDQGRTSPGNGPHIQGHMPYRGSSSQDDPRKSSNNQSSGGQRGSSRNENLTSLTPQGQNLPPRLQKNKNQGAPGQIAVPAAGRATQIPSNMTVLSKGSVSVAPLAAGSGDISLRPAVNSMVVKPSVLSKGDSPPNTGREQGLGDQQAAPSNASVAGEKSQQAVDKKEKILKRTEEIMLQLMEPAESEETKGNETQSSTTVSPSPPRVTIDDITQKMKELKIPKNYQSDVVSTIVKWTLSRTDNDREQASKLLQSLKTEGIVTNVIFMTAIKKLLGNLTQLEVDDPLVKTHLSEFIARAVAADILSLKDSFELVEPHYPMFLLNLQHLSAKQGKTWLVQKLEVSKVNLMSFLPEADRNKEQLADILDKRGLSFLMPLLRIESDLVKLLVDQSSTPVSILKWIKDNVEVSLQSTKGFILILYTSLLRHIMHKAMGEVADVPYDSTNNENSSGAASTINNNISTKALSEAEKEIMKSYRPLLANFIVNKPVLQLTALYALQTVCHEKSFPKGLLLRWFNNLYDLEIIDEEVFLHWKEDINDDYPGKGQALFQVNGWLIWLEQTEAEDEEEEDEEEDDP